MKRISFLLFGLMALLWVGCNDDDSGAAPIPPEKQTGVMSLDVTGRVGMLIGAEFTDYVKSLELLLFRKNDAGEYVLLRTESMNKVDLLALSEIQESPSAGFTQQKEVLFDSLLLGTYKIVGVGNMRDSLGNERPTALLNGVKLGNTMEQVIASIINNNPSPRLFYGITQPVTVGEQSIAPAMLVLYRKVSMFMLTLKKLPSALEQVDVWVNNTYRSFDMTGAFLNNDLITVVDKSIIPSILSPDSVTIGVIMLPTARGKESGITLDFRFNNTQVITVPLSSYVLKENTITKLTATIDASEDGGRWSMDLLIGINVNVEWNVDQEPPIII